MNAAHGSKPRLKRKPGSDAALPGIGALITAISDAIAMLDRRPPIPDEAVHSARKAIKKARAALRLLREGLDEGAYASENAALRDAGRCLSPLRDAKSLMDAFDSLRERRPAGLDLADCESLAERLRAKRVAERCDLHREPDRLKACIQSLKACRARVSRFKPAPVTVAPGLERIYRSGRRTFAMAREADTPEALHEWRKQVKYLANALKALDVSGNDRLSAMEERADKLADRLGDDHDLAELAGFVSGDPRIAIDDRAKQDLSETIGRRRARLEKKAYALGESIYREKPKDFAAGVEGI